MAFNRQLIGKTALRPLKILNMMPIILLVFQSVNWSQAQKDSILSHLTINSIPDSARVYLNYKYLGITPIKVSKLFTDTVQIKLRKNYYDDWSTFFVPIKDQSMNLVVRLNKRKATVNVFTNSLNSSILIDDKFEAKGSLTSYEIPFGKHKINARDESTGRKVEKIFEVDDALDYSYSAKFNTHSFARAALSIVIPGSAQIIDGSYLEGSLMLLGNLALIYAAITTQNEYINRLHTYDASLDLYIKAPSEIEATRRFDDVQVRKNDLNNYNLRRTISFSALIVAYIYSVVDAWINHLLTDEIEIMLPNEFTDKPNLPIKSNSVGVKLNLKLN